MFEVDLDIVTGEGTMNTFVVHPEQDGPFPVVFFYMDAPGKREELHDMARRIATVGYHVVLPNLYYRETDSFDLITMPNGETRERMFELMYGLTDEMITRDTAALIEMVDDDPNADEARIGCVGYCMSGPFAFAMAGVYPDRFRCAASIYGVRLFGEHSPAHLAHQVTGELYFACAETDEYAPKEMIDGLIAHLDTIDVNATVEWYPGTHHGFAFPQRPVYDKHAAERHWEQLFALFDRNLRPTPIS
ncbi:MAG: dienelactone hydrolase family protein [Ilumatobacteraceae bacterium]